ncbi:MAG: phage integrase N-terminal SAM-like domain-containing protein [candidate division KSB1 bacterium]|nr:phage integrase N-terminal SAM-like domain-containing protein [candidate division KSB1 bacterium]
MRHRLRGRHYSLRTEQSYPHWITRFVLFNGNRHPVVMSSPEINAFLTHFVQKERVSASTQNQARAALLFLYRHVLGREVGELGPLIRARKPSRVPVVLTRDEVKTVLGHLQGNKCLMASPIYDAGLRLMECLHLRVQDVDCARNEITVRDHKRRSCRHHLHARIEPRRSRCEKPHRWVMSDTPRVLCGSYLIRPEPAEIWTTSWTQRDWQSTRVDVLCRQRNGVGVLCGIRIISS